MYEKLKRREISRLFLYCFIGFFAILVVGFSATSPGAEEPALLVQITARNLERGRSLRLGEIARINGRKDLVWQASLVRITPEGTLFTSEELLQTMAEAGFGGVLLSLRMPRKIPVVPETRASRIVRRLANWTWKVSVEHGEPLPSGNVIFPRKLTPGTTQTVLRFQDGTLIPVRMRWFQPVCKAQRDLPEGTVLTHADICLASTERVGKRIPLMPAQAAGVRLSTNIPGGANIYTSDVRLLPAVKRRQKVSLVFRSGGILVRAVGEALEGGAIGDMIHVRNEKTRRVVEGRIQAPGIVEVQ